MPFLPATPGIVGFGGGLKPAVFQVIAPQYSLMNQQVDEDYDPFPCRTTYGDTFKILTSGIAACGCFNFNPGTDVDRFIAITGTVNGMFTATYFNPSFIAGFEIWAALNVDVATITTYPSTDGTCTGGGTVETQNVDIVILCLNGAITEARIIIEDQTFLLFDATAPVLGMAAPNNLVCGVANGAGFGGFLTYSL